MSINRVNITGNLTRDPDLRSTAGGTPVLSFGVAVNERRKNQQTGEWEDCPNFIECTMFGARAQSVARFISKGSKVAIEGKLHWSQWEKDGQKRSKIEVIVDEIEFMQQRADNAAHVNTAPSTPVNSAPAVASAPMQNNAPYTAAAPVNTAIPAQPMTQPQMPGMPVAAPVVDASIYDTDIPF